MAEDEDSRTEEATPKKLQKAQEEGQVVQSQEIKNWFAFLAMVIIVVGWLPILANGIKEILRAHLSNMDRVPMDGPGLETTMINTILDVALYLIVPAVIIILMSIIGNRFLHPFIFAWAKLKPNFSKINPIQGAKKFFNAHMFIELVKTLLKLFFVTGVAFLVVYPKRAAIDLMLDSQITGLLTVVYQMIIELILAMLILVTIIAAIDYAYQRYKYYKGQRMTKQEVKDEHKQSDGDPQVKGRLRKIRMERAMQRMMASVPDADVIVTNPTHFAVALEYKHGQMDVPVVLAKGVDNVAMKIREVATEHGIPILENPPLARILYATVEIDQEIPPEHYQAVAGVISHIMKMGRRPSVNLKRAGS